MKRRERSDTTVAWRTIESHATRGFSGYPLATIAFYGADDQVATKVAVSVIPVAGGDAAALERWHAPTGDVRDDDGVARAILAFLGPKGVRSIVMVRQIIGCPHQEGVDHPAGTSCPACPYWHERERWNGLPIDEVPPHDDVRARPTYFTDLRHFLDDDGRLPDHLPEPALNLALHQGAVVEWMTAVIAEDVEVTNVLCRRRPRRRRCRGRIVARFHPQSDAVEWYCPICDDNGVIEGWAGTPWDRTGTLIRDDDALLN